MLFQSATRQEYKGKQSEKSTKLVAGHSTLIVLDMSLQVSEYLQGKVHTRYLVLFGSLSMYSNFYRLDLHNKTCVALAKL